MALESGQRLCCCYIRFKGVKGRIKRGDDESNTIMWRLFKLLKRKRFIKDNKEREGVEGVVDQLYNNDKDLGF